MSSQPMEVELQGRHQHAPARGQVRARRDVFVRMHFYTSATIPSATRPPDVSIEEDLVTVLDRELVEVVHGLRVARAGDFEQGAHDLVALAGPFICIVCKFEYGRLLRLSWRIFS